jgi:hypothetical protein
MAMVLRELLKPGPHHTMVPDILKLGQIAAVIPVTTAACEWLQHSEASQDATAIAAQRGDTGQLLADVHEHS